MIEDRIVRWLERRKQRRIDRYARRHGDCGDGRHSLAWTSPPHSVLACQRPGCSFVFYDPRAHGVEIGWPS